MNALWCNGNTSDFGSGIPRSNRGKATKQKDMSKWYKNSDAEIINAAKQSRSISEMCRKLGRAPYGGSHRLMKAKINELNIDVSHFTGRSWNKGMIMPPKPRIPDELVFVENSHYKCSNNLRKRLLKKREHKCEKCGNTVWNGLPIPLQIHHINGIHNDNRLENLQILCPNCHAQTDSYAGKNTRK